MVAISLQVNFGSVNCFDINLACTLSLALFLSLFSSVSLSGSLSLSLFSICSPYLTLYLTITILFELLVFEFVVYNDALKKPRKRGFLHHRLFQY